jgi:hypothetical protein
VETNDKEYPYGLSSDGVPMMRPRTEAVYHLDGESSPETVEVEVDCDTDPKARYPYVHFYIAEHEVTVYFKSKNAREKFLLDLAVSSLEELNTKFALCYAGVPEAWKVKPEDLK